MVYDRCEIKRVRLIVGE